MTSQIERPGTTATGNFNHGALASGRQFDAREFVEERSLLGLNREAGYVWGSLRDDDGVLYSIMRRVAGQGPDADEERKSLGGKLILVSSGTEKGHLQLRKEPKYAVNSADVNRSLTPDGDALLSSPESAAGQPMYLKLSESAFAYREAGVVDLTGTIAAPPLQWYLPGPDSALLYTTQTWLVEGELAGKHVRGFMFWEEAWMPPGGRLYVANDPLHDAQYLTWYSWANHWDDGTSEVGHFLFGKDNFHVGVTAHSDGTVVAARSMDAKIDRAADGYWHDGINYDLDGVQWVCEPDPNGQMEGLGRMPNPQQEGRIHRIDDSRRPDVWMAWGETVPAAGNGR